MTDKTLIGIGAAVVIVPLGAFLYFGGLGGNVPKSAEIPTTSATAAARPASGVVQSAPTPEHAAATHANPAPQKLIAQEVTPAVLEHLAQSVQLSENENETTGNKRELWAKMLPVAQSLVNFSSADCEQRNWLTQFVACGQRALDNSPDYYQYARGLATMPRDNQELGSGVPSQ